MKFAHKNEQHRDVLNTAFLLICFIASTASLPVQSQHAKQDSLLSSKLMAKMWYMVKAEMTQNGEVKDIFQYRPACQHDDLFIYQSGGLFMIVESDHTCSPELSQADMDSFWRLEEGKLVILSDTSQTIFNLNFDSDVQHTLGFTNDHGITFKWTYQSDRPSSIPQISPAQGEGLLYRLLTLLGMFRD